MKIIKRILIGLVLLVVLFIGYLRLFVHENPPSNITEAGADLLAQQMLDAVNIKAWDSLPIVQWSFRGAHNYLWDKASNEAMISWDDYEVHLNMDAVDGRVLKNSVELTGKDKDKAIQSAWSYWCNDSFWLAAPFKIKDPGTKRYIAIDDDGKQALLVRYESGGVTPGDQYLWYLGQDGLPTGYKMWVKIIPIGGVYASWENWQSMSGGAKLSGSHKMSLAGLELKLMDIKGGNSWNEFGHINNPIKTGI